MACRAHREPSASPARFAALASLTGGPDPPPLAGLATAEANSRTLTVSWADGTRTIVDFGAVDSDGPTVSGADA